MMKVLTLPSAGMAMQEFELQRVDYAAATADGRVGGVQAGFPLWLAIYTVGTIGQAKSDEIRAFFSQLRGATRLLLGRDLARPYPLSRINGFAGLTRPDASPFDGSALTWSESIVSDGDSHVTLTGLPVGLVLSQLDYIDFVYDATETAVAGIEWHVPVRIVSGGTADGSGNVTVTVEPPLPTAVPNTAVAHLDNPQCTMRLLTDQSKLGAVDRKLAIKDGTIAAIQDIRS